MITKDLTTLKIHKLSQEQYDRELEAGRIDANAIYLTPYDDNNANIFVQPDEPVGAEEGTLWYDTDEPAYGVSGGNVDLTGYATEEYVDKAIAEIDLSGVEAADNVYVQAEEPVDAEDGAVWIDLDEDGGEGTAVEIEVDETLSQAGMAADAKAVGDALADKQPVGDYALKSEIPTNFLTEIPGEYVTESELNAKGYITNFTETDPTVPSWAKAATKPAYTAAEVGADASGTANSIVSTHNTASDAHNDIRFMIGDLSGLQTTAKDNLVAAINEAAASGGGSAGFTELPYFDLTEMGLPTVPIDGTFVRVETDCTAIRNAMASGPIKVAFSLNWNGNSVPFTSIANAIYLSAEDCYQVSTVAQMTLSGEIILKCGVFNIRTDSISANILDIEQASNSEGNNIPTPTESDYGKVLTATADGLKWITLSGDNIPAAEGVLF